MNNNHSFKRISRTAPRAFTLIELLLVMVILAVLAGVIIPKFTSRSEQARITAAKADISGIELMLNSFEIDCGRYPTTDEGLFALSEEPTNLPEGSWRSYLDKGKSLKDPWGNDYVYEYPGRFNEEGFDLYSMGPDMQEGSDDDVANWSEEALNQ